MYQGNWKCSQCGGAITELPFQPRSESGLTCRACFMKNKSGGSNAAGDTTTAADDAPGVASDIDDRKAPPFDPDAATVAAEAPPAPDFEDATPVTPGEKPKFEGDWQCATCGTSITSLPFQPRDTSNLRCLDCFKRSKQ